MGEVCLSLVCASRSFCSGLLYGKVMALRGREAGAELHARFGEETEGKSKKTGATSKVSLLFPKAKAFAKT